MGDINMYRGTSSSATAGECENSSALTLLSTPASCSLESESLLSPQILVCTPALASSGQPAPVLAAAQSSGGLNCRYGVPGSGSDDVI